MLLKKCTKQLDETLILNPESLKAKEVIFWLYKKCIIRDELMSHTEKESLPYANKWRRTGRIVYAIIPFVVAVALIIAGLHFVLFTTTNESLGSFWGADVIVIHPNQTYTYNVTMSYMKFPSGSFLENGSIVIEEPIIDDTITSWTRAWLPIDVFLNGNTGADCLINQTLERPNGIVEQGTILYLNSVGGGTGFGPEVTQGGTVRLALENLGTVDANVSISWKTDFQASDKPYFDYGIAALAIGLLYPLAFLIKKSTLGQRTS